MFFIQIILEDPTGKTLHPFTEILTNLPIILKTHIMVEDLIFDDIECQMGSHVKDNFTKNLSNEKKLISDMYPLYKFRHVKGCFSKERADNGVFKYLVENPK